MTKHDLPLLIAPIANTDKIDTYDVYTLRQAFLGDNFLSRDEVEQLFALDVAVSEKCREWGHFFSEAMVDFTVHQANPPGTVSGKNANWLIDQISDHGLVKSAEQMEMLVKVLEIAKVAPDSLAKFALEQVSHAVLNNQGPVAEGRESSTCVICKNDVEIIRRLMYGFTSDGGLSVSKAEAEFLFDLNDKTIENENDPAWNDLFMRGVGNYLLFSSNNAVPERRLALAEDSWNQSGESGVGTLLNRLRSVFHTAKSAHQIQDEHYERTNAVHEAALAEAAVVTSSESQWVAERIGADGVLHDNEKALLRFLKEESPNMHASLQELVDKAA